MKLYRLKCFIKKIEQYVQKEATTLSQKGLDGPQGRVICYLSDNLDRHIYQKDIEVLLDINKSGASQLISRMVKNGFIIERQSQKDKRYKELLLSEKGKTCVAIVKPFASQIDERLSEGLSEEDLTHFYHIIEKVENNINKWNGEI